ncbi:hypothetical protein SASPL_107802 [Salvia splendens]|uniref:Uncharacterized protein n=1 Tax=Salvia splendens TaxID=180675 RepID=A0A8X9A7M6_SALSN|nr:uncharacterized protein LOC121796542 [Salvia splendens]KAG6429749.1 hypothetical protein SASPL_107802 [Salvia splendens]
MSSLWGVLSETSYIISSSLLHFATLYLIFVFDKSQLLYGLALLTFNISFVSSVTTTIFRGFHRNPIKLYTSLKSLLISFFLPVLLCKLAYSIILVAILSALGICAGLAFYVMILLGLEIEATVSTCFTALVFTTMILFALLFAYLCVEWCFMDYEVVVIEEEEEEETKYGVEGSVVTGMRSVAFVMITMLGIMQGILSALFSVLAGRGRTSDAVVPQLVGYAALFAVLSLFCFVHCKAFNGDLEWEYYPCDEKKLQADTVAS